MIDVESKRKRGKPIKVIAQLFHCLALHLGPNAAVVRCSARPASAEIVGLTFHDLRHEATTRLARKLDVLDLSRMTGHRDLKSLRMYYNPAAEEIADRLG